MTEPIVISYVRAQITEAVSHLSAAMSHAGKAEWLNMEACIGSRQGDRREETLGQRNREIERQNADAKEAIQHLVNAWTAPTESLSDPIPGLLWAVFRLYRDVDDDHEFDLVGLARTESAARTLAEGDSAKSVGAAISVGSRFEYDEFGPRFDYLIEAVRVEPLVVP